MNKRLLPLLAVCLSVGSVLTGVMAHAADEKPVSSHDTAVARNLFIFNTLVKELENTYVDTIRTDEAFRAAIGAMLNTVDPYTEYYPSDSKEMLMRMTTGSYGGIGSFIMTRNGNTYISQPIEGSPALKAGLKPGDKIVRVDTTDVIGKGSEITTKLLKGEPGTFVRVNVVRPFVEDSLLTFEIERARVQEPSVPYYGVVGDNVGYIRLTAFIDKSPEEMRVALDSLRSNPAVRSLVLDLRENGGGLVESAIDILGNFLPKGTEVMRTRGRDASAERIYKTTHTPILPDMPMAVLIDGGSASASEITAGALQDLDRAVLVGNRSFGKGLVQGTMSLPYDGLLKITTAKYYIPSGRLIQALDYSHRNPDGSVARTPDSLANAYTTRAGRIVYDGGGLKPDTAAKEQEYSRLLYNVMATQQVFDYANRYSATHPEISSPAGFKVTDEIYADFTAGIDTTQMKSDKTGLELLDNFSKTAEREGFITDSLREQFELLRPMLQPDLQRDLNNKRSEIEPFLGQEIISRYYGEPGRIEYSLQNDETLKIAIGILNDPELYESLLTPRKEEKGKKKK